MHIETPRHQKGGRLEQATFVALIIQPNTISAGSNRSGMVIDTARQVLCR